MAFAQAGLDVGTDKSHWTSYPEKPLSTLQVGPDSVKWEPHVTFVGTVLNLVGNDGPAMEHRISQAEKVFHKWKPLLCCNKVSLRRRVSLACQCVFSSVLWLSETWTPTKCQQSRASSWGARIISRVVGVRRKSDEEAGQYWRRLHREGHRWLRDFGGGVDVRRRRRLHSFAGHAARSSSEPLRLALRTRCLAWWRFKQARFHCKWTGLHPRRFRAWRWEAQLTYFYGAVSYTHLTLPTSDLV